MNENTKIITNLAIAIMKKQKRERDQLERKTKELHSRRRQCKGEAKGRRREGETKGRKLKHRQWS